MDYNVHAVCNLPIFAAHPFRARAVSSRMCEDALAPNQSLWIQISESFAQARTFIRRSICLEAAWQTWDTKRTPKRRGLQPWPRTPEPALLLERGGDVEGPRTPSTHLTARPKLRLSDGSGPWEPGSAAQAHRPWSLKTLDAQPGINTV